jgi:ribosome-associated protein
LSQKNNNFAQNFSKKLMTKKQVSADELIAVIIKGIDDVKGENIQLLDLRDIENTVCDYFIICSGNSNTQVNAISGSVQKVVSKEIKDKPWHVEGETNAEWVLMDYVNVVVHIFQKHVRDFYDIESLWGDAKITQINPVKFN